MLIRTTLIALRNAVQTGNFTVMHDLGSPAFQAANSPARLGIVFADLQNRHMDLSPVAYVTPALSETPSITPGGMLKLVGYFPTRPLELKFQMLFQSVNNQWLLFGISIDNTDPIAAQEMPTGSTTPLAAVTSPVARPATSPKPVPSLKKAQP